MSAAEASRGSSWQDLPELELLLPGDAYPWHPRAVCVLEGPTLWTADDKRARGIAAELCVACPILEACDAAATARGERWGTWGGIDRETAYRERVTAPLPPRARCGTPSGYKRHKRDREDACEACKASRRKPADQVGDMA